MYKDSQRLSEHAILVSITVTGATPNSKIRSASLSTDTMENDYYLLQQGPADTSVLFPPDAQIMDIYFVLLPDDIAEGTEAFQITAATENIFQPAFVSPINLFSSTFIVILDDDRKSELCILNYLILPLQTNL